MIKQFSIEQLVDLEGISDGSVHLTASQVIRVVADLIREVGVRPV